MTQESLSALAHFIAIPEDRQEGAINNEQLCTLNIKVTCSFILLI
jgi:hypothetical protein